jgi:putative transposase
MPNVQRAYRFRLYPDRDQQRALARTFGCARFVYNHFLRLRTDAFYEEGRRVGYNDTAKLLTSLKREAETVWLQGCSNIVLQQSLLNLDAAFRNFFQGRTRYPSFKRKHDRQSARYTSNGFRLKDGRLWLAKMPTGIKVRWSREMPPDPSSVTVTRDAAGRYFASFLVEEEIEPLSVVEAKVGIDLGLISAVVLSTGEKIAAPKFLKKAQRRLAKAQRQLSRKQKGSRNRAKARLKVARIHAKVADARRDWTHKLTTRLVRENQVLAMESLSVKNMLRHPTLAGAIADVGWGEIVRQTSYKANWGGRSFVQIDHWYPSSKRCHDCGHVVSKLPLEVRAWDCPACGARHDRDVNAGRNILSAGMAILAGADMLRSHDRTAGHAGT